MVFRSADRQVTHRVYPSKDTTCEEHIARHDQQLQSSRLDYLMAAEQPRGNLFFSHCVEFFMSESPHEKSHSGLTPNATLYYTAHVRTVEDAPPMGAWHNLTDISACAAAFTREFNDARPESSVDHLLPQHFAAVNRAELSHFAQSKGTTLKVDGNPFGTLDWLEYQVPAASWPTLPKDMHLGDWTIQTDGLHILASLKLPTQLSPAMLTLMDFPLQVTRALQAQFKAWILEDERLAIGWNWHDLPASRPLYSGLIYQLPDTGLPMSGSSSLSSSIQTYVGTDLSRYLPMILADTLTLRFTTRALTTRLNETGTLSVTSLDLPLDLNDPAQRATHQTKLLETWRQVSEMQRTLDAVEDVLLAGRTWITALEGLRERGFQWKPTGPHSSRTIVHGPFTAKMKTVKGSGVVLTPDHRVSLSGRDLPTQGLRRVIRNVDHYRLRLVQQAATVKEGIDVRTSLMSARSAEESMAATKQGLVVSKRGVVLAVIALVVSALSPFLPDDWKFGTHNNEPAVQTRSPEAAPKAFGISPSTLIP